MIDVIHQINAVRRTVGNRVFEAREARSITVSQVYDSDLEDVWDACTNADRIRRWFLPVSGELRLGGRYQLEGHAGGEIQRCDPPKGFAATWESGGQISWIELRLTPVEDGTRFELDHIAHVSEEWGDFGPGAVGVGWDSILLGIARHLAEPGFAVDPAEAMAWLSSAEGKAFVTASSNAWAEADIANGEDEAAARAAAAKTLAAYTATQ